MPTEKESKKGAELCLENATNLIADAEALLKRESYGHAVFLAISAIEEAVKAFIYATNRIKGSWQSDELRSYTQGRDAHSAKINLFLTLYFIKALGKAIKNPKEINRAVSTSDFVELGRVLDSGCKEIWSNRQQGLYVDFMEGKWVSPSDLTLQDAESAIKYAKENKEQVDSVCRGILNAPLDLLEGFRKFIDQMLTVNDNWLYQNAELLYKNGKITKELYDLLLSKKRNNCKLDL